jgi:hypothetical protein
VSGNVERRIEGDVDADGEIGGAVVVGPGATVPPATDPRTRGGRRRHRDRDAYLGPFCMERAAVSSALRRSTPWCSNAARSATSLASRGHC